METQSRSPQIKKNNCYFATFQKKGNAQKVLCLFKIDNNGKISIDEIGDEKKSEFYEEVNVKKNPYIEIPIEFNNGDMVIVYVSAKFVSPYATKVA